MSTLFKRIGARSFINSNYNAESKRTLLHFAAEGAKIDVAEYLLSLQGVDVDARDPATGDTPLHVALRMVKGGGKEKGSEPHEDFAAFLVRKGANVNLEAKDWRSPAKLVDEANSNRFKVKWKGMNRKIRIQTGEEKIKEV